MMHCKPIYRPSKKTKEESSSETSFLALSDFPLPGMSLTLLVFSGVVKSSRIQKKKNRSLPSTPPRSNNCLSYIQPQFAGSHVSFSISYHTSGVTWYIPPSYPSKKSTTSTLPIQPIQDAEPSAHNAAKAPEVACNCCTW